MSDRLVAVLEAGGTKMVVALASGPSNILVRERIDTTTADETISNLIDFFKGAAVTYGRPEALSVGTFGPAELDPESENYGMITSTPKPGWAQTDLLGPLRRVLGGIPVVFETDVNAALMGEVTWGAARGVKHVAYLTVGTGIGGGLMVNGELIHGAGHPEMGHMRVNRHPDDSFEGTCPFHRDCLEGLAAGPALQARWGTPAADLPVDHSAWEIEADYLAQACLNLLMIAPPEKIILGGGVMHQEQLYPLVRARLEALLANYLQGDFTALLVPPDLGDDAGLLGCVVLGQRELLSL